MSLTKPTTLIDLLSTLFASGSAWKLPIALSLQTLLALRNRQDYVDFSRQLIAPIGAYVRREGDAAQMPIFWGIERLSTQFHSLTQAQTTEMDAMLTRKIAETSRILSLTDKTFQHMIYIVLGIQGPVSGELNFQITTTLRWPRATVAGIAALYGNNRGRESTIDFLPPDNRALISFTRKDHFCGHFTCEFPSSNSKDRHTLEVSFTGP